MQILPIGFKFLPFTQCCRKHHVLPFWGTPLNLIAEGWWINSYPSAEWMGTQMSAGPHNVGMSPPSVLGRRQPCCCWKHTGLQPHSPWGAGRTLYQPWSHSRFPRGEVASWFFSGMTFVEASQTEALWWLLLKAALCVHLPHRGDPSPRSTAERNKRVWGRRGRALTAEGARQPIRP